LFQIVQAVQLVLEELMLRDLRLHPFQVLGYEGIIGEHETPIRSCDDSSVTSASGITSLSLACRDVLDMLAGGTVAVYIPGNGCRKPREHD
jgi:hypothetical protein